MRRPSNRLLCTVPSIVCGLNLGFRAEGAEPGVTLPRTLAELQQYFDIVEDQHPRTNWLAEYNKREGISSTRRRAALYSNAFAIPRKPPPGTHKKAEEEEQRLESLIKSITLTPDSQHDKAKAKAALARFGREAVARIMESLQERKLISKNNASERLVPGRAFKMSDK